MVIVDINYKNLYKRLPEYDPNKWSAWDLWKDFRKFCSDNNYELTFIKGEPGLELVDCTKEDINFIKLVYKYYDLFIFTA